MLFLHFFHLKKIHFFVSLNKELLKLTFSTCLIVLDNLREVFGCSVINDIIYQHCLGFQEILVNK